MKIFDRFRKPKWQHRSAEVRKEAVAGLSPHDYPVVVQLARTDPAPEVRIAALRRIRDLQLLRELARSDADAAVREFIHQRFRQLLAGSREDSPPLADRIEAVAETGESDLLEFIAANGKEAELRRAALARVGREALLGDIAIGDPVSENRLAALERITQRSTLERVFNQTRKSDKQVSRRAREKLDVLIEALERPVRLREQCEVLCASAEALGRQRQWDQDYATLEYLDVQWRQLEAEVDEAFKQRYEEARQAFLAASEAHREAKAAQLEAEQAHAGARAAREALIAAVEQLQPAAEDLEGPGLEARLAEIDQAWEQAEALPEGDLQRLAQRYQRARKGVLSRRDQLRQAQERERRLQALCEEAEALLAGHQTLGERQFNDLQRRLAKVDNAASEAPLAELVARADHAREALQRRWQHQVQHRDQVLGHLPGWLDELEAAIEQGELQKATPLHDRVQASLKNLLDMGVGKRDLAPLQARLRPLSPRLRELRNWRKWASEGRRERLCSEVEALVGAEQPPAEVAGKVRAARAEWKRLGMDRTPTDQALWERFDHACTEAYKPCEDYFHQQLEERQASRARKDALCERIEGFVAEADWSHMDWKAAVHFEREVRKDWREAGPVDRKFHKELEQRFRTALGRMEEYLGLERERNLRQRRGLIDRVKSLVEVPDVDHAIEECKRLQKDWVTTVPGKRGPENELWKEFRSACDAVFDRRRQQQEAQDQELQANLERKQALCAEVEALAEAPGPDPEEARRQLHRLHAEWDEVGPIPERAAAALDKRLGKALERFEQRCEALKVEAERAQLQLFRVKSETCRELEALLESGDPEAAKSALEAVLGRWEALAPLADTAAEQGIQSRFEAARGALAEGGERLQALRQSLEDNLVAQQQLCLRMEVLAGVESPPEAAEARMQYQVSRLSEAMGHGQVDPVAEALEVERRWYLSGPVPAQQAAELDARFARACAALHEAQARTG